MLSISNLIGFASVFFALHVCFAEPPENPKEKGADKPLPSPCVTDRSVATSTGELHYRATAGYLPLMDDQEKRHAKVFLISYEKTDAATSQPSTLPTSRPSPDRPITFVFNGGPGAGSLWLHLGTAGPRRVDLPEDGSIPQPPYQLKDNPFTWLDFTDLVFIDPVGTGFSRAEDGHAGEYYSVRGDIDSVADVIRLYCTQHHRWLSPKFIIGESYGTTRAAGLSETLHDRYGIDANGIVLISTVLNFQTLNPGLGNADAYSLWLPTYAAVAWFHHKLPQDLQKLPVAQVVAQAQQFSTEIYGPALMRGTGLPHDAFDKVAAAVSRVTGLPVDYIRRARLRIEPYRFEKQLLADQGKIVGRMDGRITAVDPDPVGENPDFDPSLTGYVGVFSSCMNEYVRGELKFESDLPYEFLASTFAPEKERGEGYLDVSERLRTAISKLPALKVNVCSGWFDLATPLGATQYTIDAMPLDGEQRKRITQSFYEGGHMIYLPQAGLEKLHGDLNAFYQNALLKEERGH